MYPVPYPSPDLFSSVESSPTLGNLFTQSHSDWREGTYDNFKDWSIRQFGLKELESGDEADVPVHFQKAKDLSFEKNSRGELVLPPMHNYRTVRQKQRVIRGYVGAVYRESIMHLSFIPPPDFLNRRIHREPEFCIPLHSSLPKRPENLFKRLRPCRFFFERPRPHQKFQHQCFI